MIVDKNQFIVKNLNQLITFLRDNVTILNNVLVSILDILESIPDLKLPEVRLYI